MRLLCLLGLHRWIACDHEAVNFHPHAHCTRCPASRLISEMPERTQRRVVVR